jgi:hypothetical protein
MINRKDIDLIDQYLHDKLEEESLLSFNNRVKTDPEFAEELDLMRKFSAGIKDYGRRELRNKLKTIASKNKKHGSRKILYWSIAASLLLIVGFSGYFYLFINKPVAQKFVFNNKLPPFKKADIKFKEYHLEAAKGAVLSYHSGTIITIPKNAFIDIKGKVIQGDVSVKYREITTPEELFMAGIPMNYDSSGHVTNLKTVGVCELQVYKNDTAININPDNKINIDFSSPSDKAGYNLFAFDTISKKWLKKENDTTVVKLSEYADIIKPANTFIPRKANLSKQRFKLVYRNPSKFPEFEEYKNYTFEISDNEKNYDAKKANKNWKSVAINKDNTTGEYLVTFINPDERVTYRTHAVFEDNDYGVALNTYNNKIKECPSDSLQKGDTASLQNAHRIKHLQKRLLQQKEDLIAANIYRTFSCGKAGLWCYSKIINKTPGACITADFEDANGNSLNLKYVAILDKTNNTVLRYTPEDFKALKFDTASQNALVAITLDDNFAFIKKEDFAKLPVSGNCSVVLQVSPKKPESADEIRTLTS